MKAHARLEKAKKKADGVMDSEDLSMKEKARAVAKAMGRGKAGVKTQEKKVVVARGVNRGVKGRPKGVKGRYKIVDPRMRKEVCDEISSWACGSWAGSCGRSNGFRGKWGFRCCYTGIWATGQS